MPNRRPIKGATQINGVNRDRIRYRERVSESGQVDAMLRFRDNNAVVFGQDRTVASAFTAIRFTMRTTGTVVALRRVAATRTRLWCRASAIG